MYYLVTKWFGTFLCDREGIKDSILFPKKPEEIYNVLKKIDSGLILPEERKIVKGKKAAVNEIRLQEIAQYAPSDPFFENLDINPEDFGYSSDLLNKALVLITSEKIEKRLESKDMQVIQMINALDDLIQISNLLSERLDAWSSINMPKDRYQILEKTYFSIKEKITQLEKQIDDEMQIIAPNISSVIGPRVGARLIALAGGLDRLAKLPASTIQILGAERALFRYKKEGGKPPKHGIIFCYPVINKAQKSIRGKISRVIATKLSIAAKADAFTHRDISKYLKEEIEKKIKDIEKL